MKKTILTYSLLSLATLVFFSSTLYAGKRSMRNAYIAVSNPQLAINEITSFVNSAIGGDTKFAIGYTLNLPAIIQYRGDHQGKAISVHNALYEPSVQTGGNAMFIITMYDQNGVPILINDVMMLSGSNLCPNNCDISITSGDPHLANGRYSITPSTATQYRVNYEAASANTANPAFDEIRSVYISTAVVQGIINSGASGLRVYHAIDGNTLQRCVYVCGLNAEGEMIASSFYKGDATNLCPNNCE
ncbi:MAG: hypothetical protein IPI46_12665 [Bacteroidetes bacterium]|nr:hypothetical protein [Bacteroidota bacterium]